MHDEDLSENPQKNSPKLHRRVPSQENKARENGTKLSPQSIRREITSRHNLSAPWAEITQTSAERGVSGASVLVFA